VGFSLAGMASLLTRPFRRAVSAFGPIAQVDLAIDEMRRDDG
jgi:hypothetical protein